jgi:hypothetical protein
MPDATAIIMVAVIIALPPIGFDDAGREGKTGTGENDKQA